MESPAHLITHLGRYSVYKYLQGKIGVFSCIQFSGRHILSCLFFCTEKKLSRGTIPLIKKSCSRIRIFSLLPLMTSYKVAEFYIFIFLWTSHSCSGNNLSQITWVKLFHGLICLKKKTKLWLYIIIQGKSEKLEYWQCSTWLQGHFCWSFTHYKINETYWQCSTWLQEHLCWSFYNFKTSNYHFLNLSHISMFIIMYLPNIFTIIKEKSGSFFFLQRTALPKAMIRWLFRV